jgi:predicted Zn-dependent protease
MDPLKFEFEQVARAKLRTQGIEWIGLRSVVERQTQRTARNGKPEICKTDQTQGMMVEVLVQGQFAYAATPDTSLWGIDAAVDRAAARAAASSRYNLHPFTQSVRPGVRGEYATVVQRPERELSPKAHLELLMEITQKLKNTGPEIEQATAISLWSEAEVRLLSTSGTDVRQHFQWVTFDFEATAQKGSVVQTRTDGGLRGRSSQGGYEFLFGAGDQSLWERVRRVGEDARALVSAEECPTGVFDLVLLPDQMMLQIHESIGHPLELDRILGDERNYAGWSFVQPKDFGKLQYGSKLMNVTFDPTLPNEFASYAFDDTGNPARREFLIQDGVLKRGLGSLESQERLGIAGVANARACSWNRPPIDRMANLNLEPGISSHSDLIGEVEFGVQMESNRSWSIDDFRNKFQFGCELGRLIEKGKLTRLVRNPNYRGVTVPFWNALKKVGDQSTFGVYGTPYCGKGEPNQIIRVGHASPACLFTGVEIFGGGQ